MEAFLSTIRTAHGRRDSNCPLRGKRVANRVIIVFLPGNLFHCQGLGRFGEKEEAVRPVGHGGQSESCWDNQRQVVGLSEITSMKGKQKGATDVRREGLISITDKNFGKEVIQSDLPVLIDFWAPWCSPCRTIGPVIPISPVGRVENGRNDE